jgi:hypothetical protein
MSSTKLLGKPMNPVELGTLMHLIKQVDDMKDSVLPDDYISTEADLADQDLNEDFKKVNELISRLKIAIQNNDKENALELIAESIMLVSGIEGLFGNIAQDSRDILTGKYRHA